MMPCWRLACKLSTLFSARRATLRHELISAGFTSWPAPESRLAFSIHGIPQRAGRAISLDDFSFGQMPPAHHAEVIPTMSPSAQACWCSPMGRTRPKNAPCSPHGACCMPRSTSPYLFISHRSMTRLNRRHRFLLPGEAAYFASA